MTEVRAILLNIGDRIQVPGIWIDSTVTSVRTYWRHSRRYVEVSLDNTKPITLDIAATVLRVNQ